MGDSRASPGGTAWIAADQAVSSTTNFLGFVLGALYLGSSTAFDSYAVAQTSALLVTAIGKSLSIEKWIASVDVERVSHGSTISRRLLFGLACLLMGLAVKTLDVNSAVVHGVYVGLIAAPGVVYFETHRLYLISQRRARAALILDTGWLVVFMASAAVVIRLELSWIFLLAAWALLPSLVGVWLIPSDWPDVRRNLLRTRRRSGAAGRVLVVDAIADAAFVWALLLALELVSPADALRSYNLMRPLFGLATIVALTTSSHLSIGRVEGANLTSASLQIPVRLLVLASFFAYAFYLFVHSFPDSPDIFAESTIGVVAFVSLVLAIQAISQMYRRALRLYVSTVGWSLLLRPTALAIGLAVYSVLALVNAFESTMSHMAFLAAALLVATAIWLSRVVLGSNTTIGYSATEKAHLQNDNNSPR